MTAAEELQPIAPGIAVWHAFDPSVKADLFSTAVACHAGTLLIDPIPAAASAQEELFAMGPIGGIVVTNANHWRASAAWAEKLQIPIFGHSSLAADAVCMFEAVEAGAQILDSLAVIAIAGGAPGEIALHLPDHQGSLILGDALIHFEPYGFTFLPAKYCTNHRQMRQSLGQLLDYPSERILFAHGTPILSNVRSRLEHLLNEA
jgi:hypothetical protein